jgi:predicted MFS family arabinose efflux permease
MGRAPHARRYEWLLVATFFFTWGFVFLDRLAVAYLAPTLVEKFGLNQAQVGLFGTVSTGCYALATILFSIAAARIRRPRRWLLVFVLLMAAGASLCTLVETYGQLLAARAVLGALAGPVLPLIMLLVSKAAGEKSLGLDAGIINLGVVVIAVIVGPVLVTQVVAAWRWQTAFLSYALPLAAVGCAIALLVREVGIEDAPAPGARRRARGALREFLHYRNIRVCAVVSILAMSGYWCIMLYGPLYLTSVTRTSVQTMGFITAAMGVAMVIYAVMIPRLSDIFGRKPVLTVFLALPAAGTLLMAAFPGTTASTLAYVVCGGILGCVMPVYAILIPLETVPDHLKASANSFVIGTGEIAGGSLFPVVAGSVADAVGMPAMMGAAGGLLAAATLVSLAARETLPARARPGAGPPAATQGRRPTGNRQPERTEP